MKTLGLIGGSSWVSTHDYYRYLNQLTQQKLGGPNGARLLLWSVNFAEFKTLVESGDGAAVAAHLTEIAQRLEAGGAEALVICANTPHMHAEHIQSHIGIPLLHIGDATATAMKEAGIQTCGLLGTKFTMEQSFMKEVYARHGIETVVPDAQDIRYVHETIFAELAMDVFRPETRQGYIDVMDRLRDKGAQGMVLGCTEIPMLVKQGDYSLPLFDTAFLHCRYAVDFANA